MSSEWNRPRPEHLPAPTYTPVVLALGIVLLALGVVTSYIVVAVGALLFVIAVARWIGEVLHE